MRKIRSFPVGLILGLSIVCGHTLAEGQIVPKVERQKLAVVALPDLVLENLSVNPDPVSSDATYFRFRFRVTVRNAGQAPVDKSFSVAFQYFHQTRANWQGENDKNNCFTVAQALQPNESMVLQGRLRLLKSMLSGQNLRVRALADFACGMEFPPKNGQIVEMDENNNASNEVVIPGGGLYAPTLVDLRPSMAERGVDRVTLSGNSFGAKAGDHVLVVQQDEKLVAATVQSWRDGVITFVVPASVNGGPCRVYIGEKAGLKPISKSLNLTVLQTNLAPWAEVMGAWDAVKDTFYIRLHNWSGGPQEDNQSKMRLVTEEDIEIEKVELNLDTGHYRFLVNDLKSMSSSLNRTGCKDDQLRLDILFESDGLEMVGYYKVLGPAGAWRRTGAPDVEVNNARINIWLTLRWTGGSLDYSPRVEFEADIRSTNPVWNRILDTFQSNWRNSVRNKVVLLVTDRLNEPEIRAMMAGTLWTRIRGLTRTANPPRNIVRTRFTSSGIEVTFY